ncbi:phage NrS-1 polymerase family protein [Halomarina pelagica]|uniref:phage NrS-1 polymerase family protein n=1 Tax=Halomarina pelagica TaxID=2961599 RepID=UPI0020C2800E|nr:hypothetical protein [Halomarina sp. BND7]
MNENIVIDQTEIPKTLVEYDQWICWREVERDGKPTKVPITPRSGEFASATDEGTWTEFETATAYTATADVDGLGFVFTNDDPIVGIDLDDCRDPGTNTVDDDARDIVTRLDSYTEVSPSGTGFHVLIKGDLPEGRNRKGSVEMYDSARFFTVTGDHVDVTPRRVATRQDALTAIHREYVQESSPKAQQTATQPTRTGETPSTDVDLDDTELLAKARNASNGEKFERLWRGNTHSYDSHSEADMALCFLLAFWTGGDVVRMDQLFRQSGLMREKWDEVHYADGSTYGEKTIERARANATEFYDPESGEESAQSSTTAGGSSADAGNGGSERTQAYVTEKNRLLTDRVEELEATLDKKDEQIAALEAEVERLEAKVADQISLDDEENESVSVWERTKQLFQPESE